MVLTTIGVPLAEIVSELAVALLVPSTLFVLLGHVQFRPANTGSKWIPWYPRDRRLSGLVSRVVRFVLCYGCCCLGPPGWMVRGHPFHRLFLLPRWFRRFRLVAAVDSFGTTWRQCGLPTRGSAFPRGSKLRDLALPRQWLRPLLWPHSPNFLSHALVGVSSGR